MSRVGMSTINIPDGVTVTQDADKISAKGKNGILPFFKLFHFWKKTEPVKLGTNHPLRKNGITVKSPEY